MTTIDGKAYEAKKVSQRNFLGKVSIFTKFRLLRAEHAIARIP